MKGEIMNSPKGVKSGVPEEYFLPHMWHPSRFNPNNGSRSYVTVSEQTIQHVTQRCQICEQGLYDDLGISEK